MKGLFTKEVVGLRAYGKLLIVCLLLLILTIFFHVVPTAIADSAPLSGTLTMQGILVMIGFIISISSFSWDESSKWNCCALSMPYRKKDLVLAKYLFVGTLTFAATLLPLLLTLPFTLMQYAPSQLLPLLLLSLAVFCMIQLIISLLFPLLYHFGVEKARLILILVAVLFSSLFGMAGELVDTPSRIQAADIGLPVLLLVLLTGVLVGISYRLSVWIFVKKDL